MADTHSNPKRAASEMVEQLKNSGALDELFARIDSGEVELTGDGGLVPVLIKETLERGLQAELKRPGFSSVLLLRGYELCPRNTHNNSVTV